MKRHIAISIACVLMSALLWPAAHSATTIIRMDLPRLVQEADVIVQGRVQSMNVQWDASRRLAFTDVTIAVEDPLKGQTRRTLTIRQLGGKIGALNISVAGMPQFNAGESVIVFLRAQADNTFQVLGMNQGKYTIDQDSAVANVSGVDMYNPKTGRIEMRGFVDRAPLEALKARIREYLK